jgi:glutamate dehydrogenase
VREWGEDGSLKGLTILLGRFARGAFAQRADRIPLLKEKHDRILAASGAIRGSHIWRETRAAFNNFPKTDLFYARVSDLERVIRGIVAVSGDEEIVVESRQGAGYEALYVAFSRLRYSYQTEAALRRAFADAFGPVAFATSVDSGPVTILLFYFNSNELEHPVDPDEARRLTEPLVTSWEDRVSAALDAEFGASEGRRLFQRYVTPESRSGLYREVTAPEQVPRDLRQFEALESRLEIAISVKGAEQASVQLCSVRSLDLTDILKTMQNLGLTVTEELRIPLTLPSGRRCLLTASGSRRSGSPPRGRAAPRRRAARALDRARDRNPLNGLIGGGGWRDVERLRNARNTCADPHHLPERRTNERRAGAAQRGGGCALSRLRTRASDPARADPSARAGPPLHALDRAGSLAEDGAARLRQPVELALRTNA